VCILCQQNTEICTVAWKRVRSKARLLVRPISTMLAGLDEAAKFMDVSEIIADEDLQGDAAGPRKPKRGPKGRTGPPGTGGGYHWYTGGRGEKGLR